MWEIFSLTVQVWAALIACSVALITGNGQHIVDDYNSGALNPFNTDETIALGSKVMGFYNGSLIIRHDIPKQTSCGIFGTIFLNKDIDDVNNSIHVDALKHEWGHNKQEQILGGYYLFFVAAPSLYYNKTGDYQNYNDSKMRDRLYYSKVWERTADMLGGVNRNNYYDFWYWRNFLVW